MENEGPYSGMEADAYNPSTQECEAEQPWVQGQPGLQWA